MSASHERLVHTLRMVGVATVMADAEAAALAQMQQRATEGRLGRVEWRIAEDQSGVEEWYEHEVQFTIDTVTEDERSPGSGHGCRSWPAPLHRLLPSCLPMGNDTRWLGVQRGERLLCMVRENRAAYQIRHAL